MLCAGAAGLFLIFGYGLALNGAFLACYGLGSCSLADYGMMFAGESVESWTKPAQNMAVQFWICFAAGWFFKFCLGGLRGKLGGKARGRPEAPGQDK